MLDRVSPVPGLYVVDGVVGGWPGLIFEIVEIDGGALAVSPIRSWWYNETFDRLSTGRPTINRLAAMIRNAVDIHDITVTGSVVSKPSLKKSNIKFVAPVIAPE